MPLNHSLTFHFSLSQKKKKKKKTALIRALATELLTWSCDFSSIPQVDALLIPFDWVVRQ